MIASSTIEITYPSGQLLLTRFDASHLAEVIPVPMSILQHQPARSVPPYESSKRLFKTAATFADYQKWGIFTLQNPLESSAPPLTPQSFLGTISLKKLVTGRPGTTPSESVQEIGTVLMREEILGKGYGTVAKLAIAKHFLEKTIHVLHAATSPYNTPASTSLTRAGFVRVGSYNTRTLFSGGYIAQADSWALVSTTINLTTPP